MSATEKQTNKNQTNKTNKKKAKKALRDVYSVLVKINGNCMKSGFREYLFMNSDSEAFLYGFDLQ